MAAAALIVACGSLADVRRAPAQYAPAGAARQPQASPFAPFPPPTLSPARPARTVARAQRRAHAKRHVAVRPHPGRRKAAQSRENQREVAESKGYKRVSDLVNFPKFFPGLGIIFVKPDTLPTGPFLCFDRKDRLVATVCMVPVKDIDAHKTLEAAGGAGSVDHVSFYFNPGHPGVDVAHYHFVVWHVSRKDEVLDRLR
jgi:hypothetical protein